MTGTIKRSFRILEDCADVEKDACTMEEIPKE